MGNTLTAANFSSTAGADPIYPAKADYDASERNKLCVDFDDGDWKTFYDFLPQKDDVFLYPTDRRSPMTYNDLRKFLLDPSLDIQGLQREDRLCAAIPNGPESAVVYLVYCLRCTFAPLNLFYSSAEFEFEFADLPAKGLLVQCASANTDQEQAATDTAVSAALASNLDILMEIIPSCKQAGIFTISLTKDSKPLQGPMLGSPLQTVKSTHIALVLHTSGTTRKPKIVPLTHGNMVVGNLCHAAVNKFEESDVFINVMPMFHIAGLWENMMCTIFSGAKLLAVPGKFSIDTFYKHVIGTCKPTVYSAVPTMHQLLVDRVEREGTKHCLRCIRNDSAALVPGLAVKMETVLGSTIMPAYSMTESNPITSNPRYGPRKLRSVGPTVGPDLQVMAAWPETRVMRPGEEGEVCVRGSCVMRGYEVRPHMEKDPNIETFTDGWMRSGDKGWIDDDGYLYLSGRFKEIIKRGGETISPFVVEDVVQSHPEISTCLVFSAPHAQLGEGVGAAVVVSQFSGLVPGAAAFRKLRSFVKERASANFVPDCVVFFKDIPKGPTGKPVRINLAHKLSLPELDGSQPDEGAVWVCTHWDGISGKVETVDIAAKVEETPETHTYVSDARVKLAVPYEPMPKAMDPWEHDTL